MKNSVRNLCAVSALTMLAACSTLEKPGYNCPLAQDAGSCNSMQDAYKSATSKATKPAPRAATTEQPGSYQPVSFDSNAPVPNTRTGGMPVFEQPKVNSIWVPPYVDADGNLREGTFLYNATPGRWNYGSTKRTGRAGAAFGPIHSDDLGFEPDLSSTSKKGAASATPPKPSSDATTPARVTAPAPANVEGITQPYQRLVN